MVVIKPGRILYELGGIPEPLAKVAFRIAASKMPIPTRYITRGLA